MAIEIPDTIEKIFSHPGSHWSPEEQIRVIEWIFNTAQLNYLLRFCLYHLGSQASSEDAEDAWAGFCTYRLPSMIRLYNPEKGRQFWNYLLYCLQNECGHLRKKIHKRAKKEQPLQITLPSGDDEFEFSFEPSTRDNPADYIEENDLIMALQNCIEFLQPHHRKAFIMVVLQESGYTLASETLNEAPGTIRVWVCRARAALKKCLSSKGWNR